FAEVWRFAELLGGRPESLIGLAGTGDLVATALARQSRNRRAGELLASGVPGAEIPELIGQAVEALDGVPLLADALHRAGLGPPARPRRVAWDLDGTGLHLHPDPARPGLRSARGGRAKRRAVERAPGRRAPGRPPGPRGLRGRTAARHRAAARRSAPRAAGRP